MSKSQTLVAALVALLSTHAVQAQNLAGDVRACRLLTDTARRLACYDTMQLPVESAAVAMPNVTAVAAAPAADPVAKFGQEAIKQPAAASVDRIDTRIRGKFQGWGPNTQIEFENGQVWRIADDSSAIYDLQDPKATVRRGMLGAFYLEIEGIGFQMRVARVR